MLAEPPSLTEEQLAALRPMPLRRRSSDPTDDRPLIPRRTTPDDEDVEDLPDRFDLQGRPLNSRGYPASRPRYRAGDFERRAQRPGDWAVKGSWAMASNDDEAMQKLVGDLQGVISGQKRWTDLLQDALGVVEGGRQVEYSDEDDERRRRRRRRGRSG